MRNIQYPCPRSTRPATDSPRSIATNLPAHLPNVAFRTPAGQKVLLVLNTSSAPVQFSIGYQGQTVATTLAGNSAGTYVW